MKRIFSVLAFVSTLFIANGSFAEALEGKLSSADILEASKSTDWQALDANNTLYIELEHGRVVVALSDNLAKAHIEQIRTLAREGFYDGLSFYRVIDGFVAQGGDVFEKRDIGSANKEMAAEFDETYDKKMPVTFLPDEDGYAERVGFLGSLPVGISKKEKRIWHLHCAGAFAFGRNIEKNTASTEFYITIQPQRYLDRNLTVFGRVVQGMEHIQALRRVSPPEEEGDDIGMVIKSIRLAGDVEEAEQSKLEILRDDTETFAAYAEARRNRPEGFFYHRPDHLDICALAIPVREIPALDEKDQAETE